MNVPSFRLKSLHCALLLSFGYSLCAHAAITLDGSVGPGGNLTGPNYAITADLGRQLGANLFHSFGTFNLGSGESATFSGPGSIAHIIGRVTGGGVSTIDGLLRSTIPGASLYLINPNGLIFGPNAALDLGGSFYAGTASYISLADGGRFDAATPASSILTSAPPAAFGFLSAPAPISLHGAGLTVAQGQNLSLIGGNITLDNAAWAWAPGGRVTLTSGASPGEIGLNGNNIFTSGGSIALHDGSQANVSGSGVGGSIVIRGGRLQLEGSYLVAETENRDGGSIDVAVTGDVGISSGGWITTSTSGTGRGGDVRISAGGAITLSGRGSDGSYSAIRANTTGTGNAGGIALIAPDIILDEGLIQSLTIGESGGPAQYGSGGGISLQTSRLAMRNGGQMDSGSRSGSNGNGGSVEIDASESVVISGISADGYASLIFSSVQGDGNGGHIAIRAPEVRLENGAQLAVSTSGAGEGGFIQVESSRMSITGGARIAANTSGSGAGGYVEISATDALTIAGRGTDGEYSAIRANTNGPGQGGSIRLDSGVLTVDSGLVQTISLGAQTSGDGGNISINAGQLALLRGGQLDSGNRGGSSGQGGNIEIHASQSVLLDGSHPTEGHPSAIFANTSSAGLGGHVFISAPQVSVENGARINAATAGSGSGGLVRIEAQQLELLNGGRIIASTSGSGEGGSVEIAASDSVVLAGHDTSGNRSGIYASASSTGHGGHIQIQAGTLLADDGMIEASTSGQLAGGIQNGNAGLISLELARLILVNGGQIENGSQSGSNGNGGGIRVVANESVLMSGTNNLGEASGISGQTSGPGSGSNITLSSPLVTLDNGAVFTASTSGSGHGGDIRIDAERLAVNRGAMISTSTFGAGSGGSVNINASVSIDVASGGGSEFGVIRANTSGSGAGGSVNLQTGRLTVDDGAVQALSSGLGNAGNITIGASEVAVINGGQISSSTRHPLGGNGGNVEITALDKITVSGYSPGYPDFVSGIFANSSGIGTGGSIQLIAPLVTIASNGTIQASTTGSGDGGAIGIETRRLEILSGGTLSSGTYGSGWGGSVMVNASESILVAGRNSEDLPSTIRANTGGSGNGGNISLTSPLLVVDNGSVQAMTYGALPNGVRNGDGGNIFASVGRLEVLNGGFIDSSSISSSTGNGGNIDIEASGAIVLSGAESGLFANARGSGNGGYIFASAPQIRIEDGAKIQALTTSSGTGGFIMLKGDQLNLSHGGSVSAGASGVGAGGYINIDMSESISVSGQNAAGDWSGIRASTLGEGNGGFIMLHAPQVRVDNGVIQALTYGELAGGTGNGNAGDIMIEANGLTVANGGQIDSSSRAGSSGNGGSILVQANDFIDISGKGSAYPSAIFANTFGSGEGGYIYLKTPQLTVRDGALLQAGTEGSGAGGFIMAEVGKLDVRGGGSISASTFGAGEGGYILITASESVELSGRDNSGSISSITARTDGSGNGGYILIQTPKLSLNGAEIASSSSGSGQGGRIGIEAGNRLALENGAKIESRGDGTGDAGSILIQAGVFDSRHSQVTTEAASAGGGNIEISATSIRLSNQSAISATVGGGYGDGGNVTLNARGIAAVENSDITARADQGFGGRITINADAFLRAADIDLDASSNVIGNEGVVEVNAPKLDISGSLVVLPANFLDASSLLNDPCAIGHAGQASSFVIRSRGGIPAQPDAVLPPTLQPEPSASPNDKTSQLWHMPRLAAGMADCKQTTGWKENRL